MKVRLPIQLRLADVDSMGHVNNAIYLNYFEAGRMAFFHEAVGTKWDWKAGGLILAHNEIDYLRPIFPHHEPIIETSISDMGTKSITFQYSIQDSEGNEFANGKSVMVCFDYSKGVSIPVPDEWRRIFTQ